MNRSLEFDRGGTWFVEEPYDVAPEDVGWLFDFTRLSVSINGVVPDGRLQNVGEQVRTEHDKHRQ